MDKIFQFLDAHGGSITAIATVLLAIFTGIYVTLAWRLLGERKLALRREICEKVYGPLRNKLLEISSLNAQANINLPNFKLWEHNYNNSLKQTNPFLVYAMQLSIRRKLDDFAREYQVYLKKHKEIYFKIIRLSIEALKSIKSKLWEKIEKKISTQYGNVIYKELGIGVGTSNFTCHALPVKFLISKHSVDYFLEEEGFNINENSYAIIRLEYRSAFEEENISFDELRNFFDSFAKKAREDSDIKSFLEIQNTLLLKVNYLIKLLEQELGEK
jgi:hypothetical protein